MAGGQSLVVMMNMRVASPDLVIDISRLQELRAVSETLRSRLARCLHHPRCSRGWAGARSLARTDAERGIEPRLSCRAHARDAGRQPRALRSRGRLADRDGSARRRGAAARAARVARRRGRRFRYRRLRNRARHRRDRRQRSHPEAVGERTLGILQVLQEVGRVRKLDRRGGARSRPQLWACRARRGRRPAHRPRANLGPRPGRRGGRLRAGHRRGSGLASASIR